MSTRVPAFSPSAVAITTAAGAAGAPGVAGALAFSAAVCAVWAGSPLDEAGLFSSDLPQPQKVTSKPSSTSARAFLTIVDVFLTTSVDAFLTTSVEGLLTPSVGA